jgi:predicted O-linked N-acetylglucosamine transferase (SPINDLY family)
LSLPDAIREAARLHERGEIAAAERIYTAILGVAPAHGDALHLLGVVRSQQKRHAEAVPLIRRALEVNPGWPVALVNLGNAERALRRHADAAATYARALELDPSLAEAANGLGIAQLALNRCDEAAESCRRAVENKPDFVEAWVNLGGAHVAAGRHEAALEAFDKAIALRPHYAVAHHNRAHALRALGRLPEAIAAYDRTLELDPSYAYVPGYAAYLRRQTCDWSDFDGTSSRLQQGVREGHPACMPFDFLPWSDDPALQLTCAQSWITASYPSLPEPLWRGERWSHARIRVAYLSSDFYQHATAVLAARLFELHDRTRFEVLGLSFGPDDGSDMRRRLAAAFDRFIDVRGLSDDEVAARVRELEVDILVDLKGYTQDSRPGIVLRRAAPIQVSYLGYPGTLGTDRVDYVIGDPYVLPPGLQPFYAERIVQLPGSYQVNDDRRRTAPELPSRAAAGLPQDAFVFCCFNNNYKITPAVFDSWMRLLRAVPGSVLWLLRDSALAERNLRREAEARGVEPSRIRFAPRVPVEQHLARHRLADLFLDTLPYNAHTTASDALWMGVPVVTCAGHTFAARVAGSLLRAVGLPELVTDSMAAYEALALGLARDRGRLAALRAHLDAAHGRAPLFDTDLFRRQLEAAFTYMWQRWQRGEPPREFSLTSATGTTK